MLKVLCRSRNTLFQSGVNFPFTKTLLPNIACQVTLTIFKGLLYFLIRWVALNLTANLSPETFWHLAQFSFPHLISSSSSSVILFERNIYQQAPINLYCEAKKSTPRTFLGNRFKYFRVRKGIEFISNMYNTYFNQRSKIFWTPYFYSASGCFVEKIMSKGLLTHWYLKSRQTCRDYIFFLQQIFTEGLILC